MHVHRGLLPFALADVLMMNVIPCWRASSNWSITLWLHGGSVDIRGGGTKGFYGRASPGEPLDYRPCGYQLL